MIGREDQVWFKNLFKVAECSPQFLSVNSGWLVGSGSGTVTSNPAPAICPVDRASYRSSWFTTPPLHNSKSTVIDSKGRILAADCLQYISISPDAGHRELK